MKASTPIRVIASLGVSAGLLAWLVFRVSPQALAHAAAEVNWRLLAPATVAMVFALYFWDAVCLPTAYRVDDNRWSYWRSLHLRGLSYLAGSLHYELGQAALAWGMARTQNTSVVRMLSRSVLLAIHDIVVLLGLGLAGSMFTSDPRVERVRPAVTMALSVAVAIALLFWLLPVRLRAKVAVVLLGLVLAESLFTSDARTERIWPLVALAIALAAAVVTWLFLLTAEQRTKVWAKVEELFAGWSLLRTLRLMLLRCVYFSIFAVYAAVALAICHIAVDHQVVASTIPLVLLADGLPSVAGLGTRDTALQLLLTPDRPEALLAMSLIWSTGLIVVRSAIGLAHLWGYQLLYGTSDESVP
jgi:hypothetical protein